MSDKETVRWTVSASSRGSGIPYRSEASHRCPDVWHSAGVCGGGMTIFRYRSAHGERLGTLTIIRQWPLSFRAPIQLRQQLWTLRRVFEDLLQSFKSRLCGGDGWVAGLALCSKDNRATPLFNYNHYLRKREMHDPSVRAKGRQVGHDGKSSKEFCGFHDCCYICSTRTRRAS